MPLWQKIVIGLILGFPFFAAIGYNGGKWIQDAFDEETPCEHDARIEEEIAGPELAAIFLETCEEAERERASP